MTANADLMIDKPYAEIHSIKLTEHSQEEIRNRLPRLRMFRSSPASLTLQVRVPKTKTLVYSSVEVTVQELRDMLAYAEAQWPKTANPDDDKNVLQHALRFIADLNGSDWIKGEDVGAIDMRQRSQALQGQLYESVHQGGETDKLSFSEMIKRGHPV